MGWQMKTLTRKQARKAFKKLARREINEFETKI